MADSVRPIDQKHEEEGLSACSFTVLSPAVTNGLVIDLYKKNKKLSWQTVMSTYKEEIENDLNESGNSGDSGSASDTGSVYHDGTDLHITVWFTWFQAWKQSAQIITAATC